MGQRLSAKGEVRFDQGEGVIAHGRGVGADKGGVGNVISQEGVEVAYDFEGLGG